MSKLSKHQGAELTVVFVLLLGALIILAVQIGGGFDFPDLPDLPKPIIVVPPKPLPTDDSYESASIRAEAMGKPLVVLLEASWCQPCKTVDQTCLPVLRKSGELARVDIDARRDLYAKFHKPRYVPRLLVYSPKDGHWPCTVDLTGSVEIAGYCGVPAAGSDDVTAESVCDVPLHDKPAEKPAEKHIEKIPDKPAEKPKPSWQPPASIPEVSGHVNNTPAPHEDLEPLPQGDDYASAYARARATGRPFLVLIGAKWCIPCQQLESEPYISQLRSRGELAVLDADRDKDLAKTLAVIQGGVFLLPQLAIFSRVDRLREKALVGQEIFDWLKSAQPQAGASNTEASGDYVDVELPCKHKDKMETSP